MKNRNPLKTLLSLFWIACALSACGNANSPADQPISEADRIRLAKSDADQFKNLQPDGGEAVDKIYPMAFTHIFGGTDSASVQKYFNDRVQHLVNSSKITVLFEGKTLDTSNQSDVPTDKTEALNISNGYWLFSILNGGEVDVKDEDGTLIPLTASRVGIIELGAAYKATVKSSSGKSYAIPVEDRQAVLVHEARHSDCTGGVSESLLKKLNEATDDNFDTLIPVMACGHKHQKCLSGDYAGYRACDGEAFGAYTVGALFALSGETKAMKNNDQVGYEILHADFVDYLSRVQGIDEESILSDPSSPLPDMSSDGFHP